MNTVNASTGFMPFQLKTGRSPHLIPPLVSKDVQTLTSAEADAQTIINNLHTDIQEAQDRLLAVKIQQAYHANQHRGPEDVFQIGDLVMLSTANRRRNYMRNGKKRVAK
ncbi:hypothetical protein M422DRAFT_94605, partial [Sphaerobolus stellatus SS14]